MAGHKQFACRWGSYFPVIKQRYKFDFEPGKDIVLIEPQLVEAIIQAPWWLKTHGAVHPYPGNFMVLDDPVGLHAISATAAASAGEGAQRRSAGLPQLVGQLDTTWPCPSARGRCCRRAVVQDRVLVESDADNDAGLSLLDRVR